MWSLIVDGLIKNTISAIALLIAILSAYYSYRNGNIAKNALKISEKGFLNKQSNFSLYLIDSFRLIKKRNPLKKILLFHITINNKSENKNSFKAVLEIEYIREDNSVEKIRLLHNPNLKQFTPQEELTLFDEDIGFDEKSIQSKWLIFDQPTSIIDLHRIDKYTIVIIDVNGIQENVETVLIKDINYEANDE